MATKGMVSQLIFGKYPFSRTYPWYIRAQSALPISAVGPDLLSPEDALEKILRSGPLLFLWGGFGLGLFLSPFFVPA